MGLFGKSKGADPKEQVDKEQIVFGCIIMASGERVVQETSKRRERT